jgi:hypothetical protein
LKRTLSIKREALVELAVEELTGVVGGQQQTLLNISCSPVKCYSLEQRCSWSCP